MFKTVRFVSLYLTALLTGLLFCHLLELPNKMKLPAGTWLTVQQVLYNEFGPVSSVIEPLAILSTLAVLIMVRGRRFTFILTLIALVCLIVHLASWFAVVDPVNLKVNSWTHATMPADWVHARDRWECGHAAGAGLTLIALASLIGALLADM